MHQPIEDDYKGTEKLKYAIVELIADKGRASTIDCGLLRGIGKDKESDDEFMWAVTPKKVVRGFSLAYYNILSVVTFDGHTKVYTFFMADEDEQKEARKIAERAYEGLKDLALPEGERLLDVSKFENVPEDFNKLSIVSNITTPTQHTGAATGQGKKDWYGKGHSCCGYTTPTYVANTDPTPFSWKRKTKKPTKKALEELREKLDMIAKREYKFAPRAIKGEKEKEKEEKADRGAMFQGYDDDSSPFCT